LQGRAERGDRARQELRRHGRSQVRERRAGEARARAASRRGGGARRRLTPAPSEFALIRRYFARPAKSALLGGGDDAAFLQPASGIELAVSTALLLEGRHFRPGADARKLGHKALAVNLSDMAAMGATPRWAMLGLALPVADEAWIAA